MNKQIVVLLVVSVFLFLAACQKDAVHDKNRPFIEVVGSDPYYWGQGVTPYIDPGVEAWDITDYGDTINITDRIQMSVDVDVNNQGEYEVRYNVADDSGNPAQERKRTVKVVLTK